MNDHFDNVTPFPGQVNKTLDVLIVGAGISGIGMGCHLQDQMPGKSFAILEARGGIGGTWRIHKYPGIRSDSDLYTFGYRFKPWTGKPIAEAGLILEYLEETIDEFSLRDKIEFDTRVTALSWSSQEGLWTARILRTQTGTELVYKARFLWMCQGYYEPDKGYTPQWPGSESYEGTVIHPQTWPEGFDYSGKKVLVIGSGATAATVVPNMADKAGHVTMLQRSPTYFYTGENRSKLADFLNAVGAPKDLTHRLTRWWILLFHQIVQSQARSNPEFVKKRLMKDIRALLPKGFDVEKHFTPAYRPWQQRLAFVPDGDLFRAVTAGKVSVVTDQIKTFTPEGVMTQSGEHLEADVIITATGFNLSVMGGIPFDLDGEPLDFSKVFTYRGCLFSGVPNMAYMFGYLRTSWTMRVDLVSDFVLRVMRHMEETGTQVVTPTPADPAMPALPWIAEDDFNPGYIKRRQMLLPKQSDRDPWIYNTDYYTERKELPKAPVQEPELIYATLEELNSGAQRPECRAPA